MKKHIFLTAFFATICMTSFAADCPVNLTSWNTSCQDLKIIPLTHLNDTDLQEIMQGKHPQLAVEFAAQTSLPISFYLSGNLVSLVENYEKWGTVEIKQTFYARYVGENLILSSNATDWKPFLEFITGNAKVVLKVDDGRPSIVFGAETNRQT